MYRYEKLIDIYTAPFLIQPTITARIAEIINEYKFKNFSVEWDLLKLDDLEIGRELDLNCAEYGTYFYCGIQWSYKELQDYFEKNLRKLTIKITEIKEGK